MSIAKTIANQIGNPAFRMMGARDLVDCGRSLRFKLGRGAKNAGRSVTHVQVELDPSDTYTVRFFRVRSLKVETLEEVEGVYCDMLHDVIQAGTGFYLSL